MPFRALVSVDHHFLMTPDKKVYVSSIHDALFWQRYTDVFDEIGVLCRLTQVPEAPKNGYLLSSADRVVFLAVKDFRGPKQYLINRFWVQRDIRRAFHHYAPDGVIVRVPSTIGYLAAKMARNKNLPLAAEVVADPADAYTHSGFLGRLAGKQYTRNLKNLCRTADGVSYVTQFALQKRYPAQGFSTHYSSIDLTDDFFYDRTATGKPLQLQTIIHVSNIHSPLKGHDTLFKTLAYLQQKGLALYCMVVGDGKMRGYYENMAEQMGLGDLVCFTGNIDDKLKLRQGLISADALVYPSRAEGLPRVVIESMAVSLPCLSTPVGGTPELLPTDCLFHPDDVEGFGNALLTLSRNPARQTQRSRENYQRARDYSLTVLKARRHAFYTCLSDKIEQKRKENP